MTQMTMRQCDWCDHEFEPNESLSYSLMAAGQSICLECADKWEEAEVKLHNKRLTCFVDNEGSVKTATGHKLPIRLTGWTEKTSWRTFKLHLIGEATDVFGKHWLCKRDEGVVCTLIPKERRSWQDSLE